MPLETGVHASIDDGKRPLALENQKNMMKQEFKYGVWCIAALLTLAACGTDGDGETPDGSEQPGVVEDDTNFPLEDLDTLVGDHPVTQGKELARYDSKFDLTLPPTFNVIETQSPVRNQQSRGVCSIFSTVGLMEHLYIKAGMQNPDFSEQFLQWSSKSLGGSFPNTSGSSGNANLTAINRFGVPEESAWPYEGRKWTASNDPDCDRSGDSKNLPTKCHTNGDPSQMTLDAKRFFLPRREYVSNFTSSLQTYMFKNKRAIICGMDFFYQSWSHGGSSLGINAENKSYGAVVTPGPESVEEGREKPAGHSILLVGYDEEKQFPRLDAEGKALRDDQGNIIYDKGFFLFKNSWGTGGSWGSKNEFGSGYGWLSFDYVQRFGRCVSAGEPDFEKPVVEICGDGMDNDANGVSDCDDSACSANMACSSVAEIETFESTNQIAIPDNDEVGIEDVIVVGLDQPIAQLKVTVDIEHSWKGDLDVILTGPNGEIAIIAEADGEAGKGIQDTFFVEEFNGAQAAGEWTLSVSDGTRRDEGQLNGWSLEITH